MFGKDEDIPVAKYTVLGKNNLARIQAIRSQIIEDADVGP